MDTSSYPQRIQWFHKARFGMFIHWGLYSLLGHSEWTMYAERIPAREYARLADNTFIGFAQGALINKPRNIGDHVDIRGNAFHGFTDYALRVHEPAAVASDDNLYVPAGKTPASTPRQ